MIYLRGVKMSDSENYDKAAKKVDTKIKFYNRFVSYVIVNLILFVINFLFSKEYWWFLWVVLIWGIFILIDFIKIFVLYEKFGDNYRENKIQEELDKINK